MNPAVRATAAAFILLAAQTALAQPGAPAVPDPANLRGDSTQTRKRLVEAEQKLLGGKAADAADDLQRVLDESADDLIAIDSRQYQPARWVAHGLLAKLPPDVLKAYQDRIDQPARKLLDQAKRDRDPRPLWQLLDRYFVSRPADEAILLLGDLLFERGEFRAAEDAWRRLLPDAGADIVYPGSKADAALVRARIVLAVIFQNDAGRAKAEVTAFKAKHAAATGTLAGKTGPLADVLQAFLAAPPKLAPDAAGGAAWPAYGGGPDRAGRVPGGIPNAWPSRPAWTEAISPNADNDPPGTFARQPFGHPVIIGGTAFVASGTRVFSFDLRTGKQPQNPYSPFLILPPNARASDTSATLTAAGGLLYARIGPPAVRAQEAQPSGKFLPDSFIACLNPRADGKLSELWKLPPPVDEKTQAAWEGAPLVSGRRLWAVYARFEGGRVIHTAMCYDPADVEKQPGSPVWMTELCDSPLPGAGGDRTRQELLTLAGRHLVFCSNNGAIVAVDAVTGRRAWGFRYARSRKAINNANSEPAPAVAFGGRVFVAPADGERVYALDADTGKLVWESGPTESARILGVARGRLVVTVTGPIRGIRGLNLDTGSHRAAEGGWEHSDASLISHGQGLVSDELIVWPSRDGLYFLDPLKRGELSSGTPNPLPGPPRDSRAPFGNLAYADGVLIVVTPTQVRGYFAQSRKIETRPETTPRERFDALIDRAERELAAGNAARANELFAEIATSDLPPPFRAWAAARLLQLAPPASDLNRLPPAVRDALRPALLNEWILPPDGVPVTLDAFLQRRLGRAPAPASVPIPTAAGRKPCGPNLSADADIDRTLKLPPAVAPLIPIAGGPCPPKRLFAAGPRALVAVPLDQSAESEHAPADLFTHAADLRDGFVAAGPFAVAVYGAAREPLWVFRVPVTERLPHEASPFRFRSDGEPASPHLTSFVMAGPWLLARVGEYHLIALDLQARRVAWVLGATGRPGYEPVQFPSAARFGPHLAVSGKYAVVQLSDGRRWFVKLDTGRPVMFPTLGDQTARTWWPQAPANIGDYLALPDGAGLVRLVQLGGRVKWAYEVERDDGLTGEPAQARAWGDVLLVAVRRNHGVEIERVNLADGKRVWSEEPAFADADRIDLSAADADADRAYVPAANKLLAFTLASGKPAWEANLPDARGARGWVVRAGKTCVIAYPVDAIPAEPPGAVWDRLRRSFAREPFAWRLPALATSLYDAWVDRAVPVMLLDPETGKRLARFDVPAHGSAVTAYFDANTAVIATGDRVVWIK